jgi:hypothetical protein
MTLEQQVASLVSATTALTNVVNGELESVRAENSAFRTSTNADITELFNSFTSQFDEVKLQPAQFSIYVDPVSGSSSPINPVNNIAAPFDTIANALDYLSGCYWSNGYAVIRLSAGDHFVSTLSSSHSCAIMIRGVSTPDFSGVSAIVSQTTNANRTASAATAGSNANLFNHLTSIFQSRIISLGTSDAFYISKSSFYLTDCLVYPQNKDTTSFGGIRVENNASVCIENSAFMYFSGGIRAYSANVRLVGFVLSSANSSGFLNYGSLVVSSASNFALYLSGNSGVGISSIEGVFSSLYGSVLVCGNGSHGIHCSRGEIRVAATSASIANGGSGFYAGNGDILCTSSISQNNGQYGYRADAGLIKALSSDTNTTGNTSGKKLENNAQQAYVIGVNL